MTWGTRRYIVIGTAALLGLVAVACGSSTPGPTPRSDGEVSPTVQAATPTIDSRSTPSPSPVRQARLPVADGSESYDASTVMYQLFNTIGRVGTSTLIALEQIRLQQDRSMVPVLVEVVRFLPFDGSRQEAAATLRELTGESFGEDWLDWTEWLGRQGEKFQPPAGYLDWKISLLSSIDPRFELFLRDADKTSRIDLTEVVWGSIVPDGIPDLQNPKTISPGEADYLGREERVFGVSIGGEHRAYPLRITNPHEMVNDVLGGEPIVVSWCTLCGSGIVYSTLIRGEPTTFGTSGLLYRSNKLMYDRATNSLWSQLLGQPVIGPLAGSGIKLKILPVALTTWGEWLDEHPDTTVLSLDTGVLPADAYRAESDPDSTYFGYRRRAGPIYPVANRDQRLESKDEVLGLTLGDLNKAYSVRELQRERVTNDSLGNVQVVIVASSLSSNARVYARQGQEFLPPKDEDAGGIPGVLTSATGGRWQVTEEALVSVDDPSMVLRRIPSHISFWFGWFAVHPDTLVYKPIAVQG